MHSTKNGVHPDDVTIKAAVEGARKLVKVGDELREIFPERDHLITQMLYGLAMREHVLAFGTHGTGKSDLVHSFFNCIEGANQFSIQLSKFMTEGYLFGLPNVKVMRDEGRIEHMLAGSILEADLAEVDEVLDGPDALLRALLGVFNERRFDRGQQHVQAKLHMAVASTNGVPSEIIRHKPELAPVLDRFILHNRVEYLQNDGSRRQMYTKYLLQAQPETRVSFQEICLVTTLIRTANQVVEPAFIEFYDKAIEAFRKAIKDHDATLVISDRRACKLLKIIEASAIFHGRFEVDPEDILEVRFGACLGNDQAEHDLFLKVVSPIVEEAKNIRTSDPDEAELKLLAEYEHTIPEVPAQLNDTEMVALRRTIKDHRTKIEEVLPKLESTNDRKKKILQTVDARIQEVTKMME